MMGTVILSPSALDPIISEMAVKYSVEPALIKAHIKAESNWDVNASRYEVGHNDASWGLMQLMLETARGVLGDPNLTTTQLIQPRVNIEAGTKFISQNLNRFGNMRDAIAAYNAGSPRLNAQGKYVNQVYVDRVTKNYNIYSTLGTGIVAEATINVEEVATSEEVIPVYILLGIGIVGLVIMMRD